MYKIFTNIYEKIKNFIIENYLILLFYLIFIVTMTHPLPYYVYTGGGIINVDDKIIINDNNKSTGSFNMCYVSEIEATIPTYLLSYIIPSWDLISKNSISLNEEETKEEILLRDKIYLNQANQNAILNAYKEANRDYEILNSHIYIIYVNEDIRSILKIGDELLEVDNIKINDLDDIHSVLEKKNIGEEVSVKILRNNKEYIKKLYIKEVNNNKIIGISIEKIFDYETNPVVDFKFSNSESGPSGGFILSLALYDKLVTKDITNGLKIAGTGTIDEDGKVGEIGGVKYKLKGAVDSKVDIFLVPNGKNYKEAISLKEKYNYKIKIIGIDTLAQAIKYLEEM